MVRLLDGNWPHVFHLEYPFIRYPVIRYKVQFETLKKSKLTALLSPRVSSRSGHSSIWDIEKVKWLWITGNDLVILTIRKLSLLNRSTNYWMPSSHLSPRLTTLSPDNHRVRMQNIDLGGSLDWEAVQLHGVDGVYHDPVAAAIPVGVDFPCRSLSHLLITPLVQSGDPYGISFELAWVLCCIFQPIELVNGLGDWSRWYFIGSFSIFLHIDFRK